MRARGGVQRLSHKASHRMTVLFNRLHKLNVIVCFVIRVGPMDNIRGIYVNE